MGVCDEWGGAESRGNGVRPVELMVMSDTCATHRSRVPRRSSGRIKGGVTTVEDERGPGLDFNLCFVCGSRPWGAAALLLCLFMLLKYFECSPVPASFFPIYELCYNNTFGRCSNGGYAGTKLLFHTFAVHTRNIFRHANKSSSAMLRDAN